MVIGLLACVTCMSVCDDVSLVITACFLGHVGGEGVGRQIPLLSVGTGVMEARGTTKTQKRGYVVLQPDPVAGRLPNADKFGNAAMTLRAPRARIGVISATCHRLWVTCHTCHMSPSKIMTIPLQPTTIASCGPQSPASRLRAAQRAASSLSRRQGALRHNTILQ